MRECFLLQLLPPLLPPLLLPLLLLSSSNLIRGTEDMAHMPSDYIVNAIPSSPPSIY